MPFYPPRPAWWRIPTPSCLILVLLLCFLPWLEVGCESKLDLGNQLGGFPITGGGKATLTPGLQGGKQVLVTQSGLQIAAGKYTKAGILADMPEGGGMGAPGGPAPQSGTNKEPDAAPLLFAFFLAVLAAIATGFAMPPGRVRALVVGACTAAAIVILLLQALVLGFPAANDVAKSLKNPAPNSGLGGTDGVSMFVRYTPAYWIMWVLLIGALIPLILEEVLSPKKRLASAAPPDADYAEPFTPSRPPPDQIRPPQ